MSAEAHRGQLGESGASEGAAGRRAQEAEGENGPALGCDLALGHVEVGADDEDELAGLVTLCLYGSELSCVAAILGVGVEV